MRKVGLFHLTLIFFFRSNMTNDYFNNVYIKPWCRLAPYALGLAIGYIFYEVYQRSNTASWDHFIPRATIYNRYHYFKQILTWTFALIILTLCLFGTYGDYSGHPLTRRNRIVFLALSRFGWSIGLCIVIIACFAGHGGEKKNFNEVHRIFCCE